MEYCSSSVTEFTPPQVLLVFLNSQVRELHQELLVIDSYQN